ncbi:MAG: translation initiation factor IF-2, partial [Myxococcales bacterium]|nr:translation initiation factor IF-2 [Myxococcales bacterium]
LEGSISVAELAKQLGAKGADVQGKLMGLGTMVSINQTIDSETAGKVAESYGFEIQDTGFKEEEALVSVQVESAEADLVPRPPVITVMGHVDHGKTSLLDALRETDVVAGEAGGITQHIGAYQVTVDGKKLTFIDTPGHAAFTEMRARGAQLTDIVILVVAASEGVMPQTQEAIAHAKAAGVPILVAINKCDLPGADPQRTRQSLLEHDLVPEEFGGDVITTEISALKRTGLDKLLELLALQSEVLELKADAKKPATGVVLEAQLDKGRGPVATILVKEGTLNRGDALVVGTSYGRIRAMQDEKGKRVDVAPPSTPVQVIGLSSVPDAGDVFHVAENERAAKDVAEHREDQLRGKAVGAPKARRSLEDLFAQASGEGGIKELNVVLKTDVQGTLEAVRDALLKLGNDEVKVDVVLSAVGAISENDVNLAETTGSIVVGFNVRPDPAARKAAESSGVDMRMYRVIYELTDEVKLAMAGLLPPRLEEQFLGRAEVRETFTVPKIGTIAGCYIVEGKMTRNAKCRLVRDGVLIHEGQLGSLRRFKDDVREVQTGFECGIGIDGYNDLKIGDVIEAYTIEERAATLE